MICDMAASPYWTGAETLLEWRCIAHACVRHGWRGVPAMVVCGMPSATE